MFCTPLICIFTLIVAVFLAFATWFKSRNTFYKYLGDEQKKGMPKTNAFNIPNLHI
jgi:hypothetical protein